MRIMYSSWQAVYSNISTSTRSSPFPVYWSHPLLYQRSHSAVPAIWVFRFSPVSHFRNTLVSSAISAATAARYTTFLLTNNMIPRSSTVTASFTLLLLQKQKPPDSAVPTVGTAPHKKDEEPPGPSSFVFTRAPAGMDSSALSHAAASPAGTDYSAPAVCSAWPAPSASSHSAASPVQRDCQTRPHP